ncbi:MAG: HEAT repeat domain-containing protein, partial [Planctomycetaceae bacterium]|nr:HEAT repeat domain-containing protein [Planctomycetaceae bacterium]
EYTREQAIDALGAIKGDPKKIVPVMCEALKKTDSPYSVLSALRNYGEHAEAALPQLQSLLDSPEELNREYAVIVLGKLGAKAKPAIPRLQEMIKNDGDDDTRNEAAKALLQIAPESQAAGEILEASLRGTVEDYWLIEFRDKRKDILVKLLTNALDNKDGKIRAGALRELKRLRNVPGQEAAFVKALKDSEAEVRLQAVLALFEIGGHNKAITPVLVESLGPADEDNDWELGVLMEVVGARAAPGMAHRAADRKEPEAVRKEALNLLMRIGSKARHAIPQLKKITLDDTDPMRFLAALAWQTASPELEEIQGELTPILLSAAKSKDVEPEIRDRAVSVLGYRKLQNAQVLETLFAMLINPATDEDFRQSLTYSLGSRSLDEPKIRQLIEMLDNSKTQALALSELGRQETLPAEAVTPLMKILKTSDDFSYLLKNALVRTGEPGLKALLKLAEDSSAAFWWQTRALDVLGQFSEEKLNEKAVAGVTPLLTSESLQKRAALTLARLGKRSDRVLDILVEELKSSEREQRYEAQQALDSLSEANKP